MAKNQCLPHHQSLMDDIIQQLSILGEEFANYNELVQEQLIEQQKWIKRMRILSQRYILIVSTGPCCKFPEIYPNPTSDYLLQEMTEKIRSIRISNCILYKGLKKLRKLCLDFERLCHDMEPNTLIMPQDLSPLLVVDGDLSNEFQDLPIQSVSFYIEFISNLFQYFHAWILKLRHSAHLIEPSNFQYLNVYDALLKRSEDFDDYLIKGLTYCKRLQMTEKKIQCENIEQ